MDFRTIKKFVPAPVRKIVRGVVDRYRVRRARRAWKDTTESSGWLGRDELERLQARYALAPRMQYDPDSLARRGKERFLQLKELLGGRFRPGASLELGCGDGMVSYELQQAGFAATALDNSTDLFDKRAEAAGVRLHEMDAAELEFGDGLFDLAFCYNTFEHFKQPDRVLDEIHRVLRPGGFLVAVFNPIYSSPYGLHAYYSISVPYCQFLFEPAVLDAFCAENGMEPINYGMLNKWSGTRFRKLWEGNRSRFDMSYYREQLDCSGLDLVWSYPSCFRGKTESFDDLVVAGMECVFRKKE
jgi:SAM-dependent methyltransferase